MDRYEFETHSAYSPSLTSSNPSSLAMINPQWISMIDYFLRYSYPIVLAGGIIFCLLTMLTLAQRVYMTSKPYLFVQSIFDTFFLLIGIFLTLPHYYPHVIQTFVQGKIYLNAAFYALWFIVLWLFLISCLDHTCTAIQSNGHTEKLFCSPCNSKNIIVGIILMGILSAIPQLFAWEYIQGIFQPTQLRTSFLYEQVYFWFLHIVLLFIPLFAIFVFMGTLMYTLCKKKEHYLLTSNGHHTNSHYTIHYANPHDHSSTSIHRLKTRERQNISKFFVFSCFLHLILVLPYAFVLFFGKLFLRESTTTTTTSTTMPTSLFGEILIAHDLSLILFYIQIFMRFFVLIIFSGHFRLCLKRLITCRCCCCCCNSSNDDDDHETYIK